MDTAAPPWIEPRTTALRSPRRTYPALQVHLAGVPRGAVVVLSDAGAVRESAIVMNRLALHGYESIALDATASDPAGRPLSQSDDDLWDCVLGGLDEFARRGWQPEQAGVVGYGLGGRGALAAARRARLGAAVSVSPTWLGEPRDVITSFAGSASAFRTPWLGLFGGQDANAPAAELAALDTALAARSPVYSEVVVYPGVAAHLHRDSRSAQAHAASFDSWQRTVEWLNLRVVPRATPLAEAWRRAQVAAGSPAA